MPAGSATPDTAATDGAEVAGICHHSSCLTSGHSGAHQDQDTDMQQQHSKGRLQNFGFPKKTSQSSQVHKKGGSKWPKNSNKTLYF
jgi:hypothetical protein